MSDKAPLSPDCVIQFAFIHRCLSAAPQKSGVCFASLYKRCTFLDGAVGILILRILELLYIQSRLLVCFVFYSQGYNYNTESKYIIVSYYMINIEKAAKASWVLVSGKVRWVNAIFWNAPHLVPWCYQDSKCCSMFGKNSHTKHISLLEKLWKANICKLHANIFFLLDVRLVNGAVFSLLLLSYLQVPTMNPFSSDQSVLDCAAVVIGLEEEARRIMNCFLFMSNPKLFTK